MFRLFFVYFSFILYNFYIYLQYLNIKPKHHHAHLLARINNYKQDINIFTILVYYCLYFVNYKLNINILIISPNPCRFYHAATTAASTLMDQRGAVRLFKQGNDRLATPGSVLPRLYHPGTTTKQTIINID